MKAKGDDSSFPFVIGVNNMDKLKFYNVPNEYVEYLQQKEILSRGFSRVPNLEYSSGHNRKFVCGIVLKINDLNYFAPVTSYKKQKPDNFLIRDKRNNVVSSLRFNYMFPVPLELATVKNFKKESNIKYRNLLEIELKYCRSNELEILRLAKRTYNRVMIGKNPGLIHNSCNFKLLEQASQNYILMLQQAQSTEPILPNQIPDLGSQGFGGFTQGNI